MMQLRRPLIAGNWKMNGLSADALPLAGELANRVDGLESPGVEMLICPPFPYLDSVAITLKQSGLALGAQDCHPGRRALIRGM